MIEPHNVNISISRQCELVGLNRSTYYYEHKPDSQLNIELMHRIDEIYTKFPFYGARKITAQLNREMTKKINHKRIERLMKIMGIQAIFPQKNLSKANVQHDIYPYLLKNMIADHPNHIWGTDITYIRAHGLWFYLVAIIDWYSRYVISWELSDNLKTEFCKNALDTALKIAIPDYHNSDQGVQFISEEYVELLKKHPEIDISMDGRGRCFDNIFTERLWRSLKYEEVYLKDYNSFEQAKQSINNYFILYNNERLYEAINYKTPAELYV